MKNNRKNRKLQFIREKNKLRLGIKSIDFLEIISSEILKDDEALNNHLKKIINIENEKIHKRYRLYLKRVHFTPYQDYSLDCSNNKINLNYIIIKLTNKN